MSTFLKDKSSADAMPSHVEGRSSIFTHTVGKTTLRSGVQDSKRLNVQLGSINDVEIDISDRMSEIPSVGRSLGLHYRLNEDSTANDERNRILSSRTFGLQSKFPSSGSSMPLEEIIEGPHHKTNTATASKMFGLMSEDINGLNLQNNGIVHEELRKEFVNSSGVSGFHSRNLILSRVLDDSVRVNGNLNSLNFRKRNLSETTRASENVVGINEFNQSMRRNPDFSLTSRLFLQSRNQALHPGSFADRSLRLNQNLNMSNNITVSKTFGPTSQNTLTTGFQTHNNVRHNVQMIDNGGFRRPSITRVIRGRNSTLSSRLFYGQDTRKHCKDLSNINGFNVSHIPKRNADTMSESMHLLNMRNNGFDNQSIGGSVLSVSSMKSQFMNLLENLHHSILSIGPHVTAEAVRMEFDRAKQRLENISEISFAPSVKETDGVSVISHSSKYICPQMNEQTKSYTLDGGSLQLKSSQEIIKTFLSSKDNSEKKSNLSDYVEGGEGKQEKRGKEIVLNSLDENQDSSFVFKKPKSFTKKTNNLRMLKIKSPQVVKEIKSKSINKMINLEQWYPIALGSDLAFCGVDEQGAMVKTEAVKKRLNNRRVELINGLCCNLIGSPSAMVSILPKKILILLKNGLTDRWRILQKELLNCQTAEEEKRKRISKSPKMKSSSEAKSSPKKKSFPGKTKGKSEIERVISTPKKKVPELQTRSGRTVKPPAMFWLTSGSDEITSSLSLSTDKTVFGERTSKSKSRKSVGETPLMKSKKKKIKRSTKNAQKAIEMSSPGKKPRKGIERSPDKKPKTVVEDSVRKNQRERLEESLRKPIEETPIKKNLEKCFSRKITSGVNLPGKNKKAKSPSKKPKRKPLKRMSPKKIQKKEIEKELKVTLFPEETRKQSSRRDGQIKRKRKLPADADSIESKKKKLDEKTEFDVESTESVITKKKKTKLTSRTFAPKSKGNKSGSPVKKKQENVKKKMWKNTLESEKETNEVNEFEDDIDLKLDDIEIPEISNVGGNPHLSISQLRLVSMETPPLKYFNNNLKLLRSATPVRSPDWCISQRTESEVKQFQKRREEALRKKIKVDIKKTVVTEKGKNIQNRDVKRVMEWVAEKTVKSPVWGSRVLQYVIPSRKKLEQQEEEEEDDTETRFL